MNNKQKQPSKAFVKEMSKMYPKGATITPAKKNQTPAKGSRTNSK
jgi:hypothetical protein